MRQWGTPRPPRTLLTLRRVGAQRAPSPSSPPAPRESLDRVHRPVQPGVAQVRATTTSPSGGLLPTPGRQRASARRACTCVVKHRLPVCTPHPDPRAPASAPPRPQNRSGEPGERTAVPPSRGPSPPGCQRGGRPVTPGGPQLAGLPPPSGLPLPTEHGGARRGRAPASPRGPPHHRRRGPAFRLPEVARAPGGGGDEPPRAAPLRAAAVPGGGRGGPRRGGGFPPPAPAADGP